MSTRPWIMLSAALIVSISGDRAAAERLVIYAPDLLASPVNTAAIPVIVFALVFLLLRWLRMRERWSWAFGGLLFGLTLHAAFDIPVEYWWLAFVSMPLAMIGAAAGERLHRIVKEPHSWRAVLPLLGACFLIPLLTGVIDLYWRLSTP